MHKIFSIYAGELAYMSRNSKCYYNRSTTLLLLYHWKHNNLYVHFSLISFFFNDILEFVGKLIFLKKLPASLRVGHEFLWPMSVSPCQIKFQNDLCQLHRKLWKHSVAELHSWDSRNMKKQIAYLLNDALCEMRSCQILQEICSEKMRTNLIRFIDNLGNLSKTADLSIIMGCRI